jgi:hypothetical protein
MKSSADLAALLGQDLPGAARILGRALEEPTRGMMMLRRAGIVLTEAEKERIKTLKEQGKLLEAQKVLLKAVNDIVGGQAAAALNTASGASKQLSEFWGDLWETLGEELLPALREFRFFLVELTKGFIVFAEKTQFARDAIFNVVAAFFKAGQIILQTLIPAFKANSDFLENVFKPVYESIMDFFIERLADGTAGIVNFKDMVIVNLEEMLLGAMGIFRRLADAADTMFGGVTDKFANMRKGLDTNIGTVGADYIKRLLRMQKSREDIERQLRGAKPRKTGAEDGTGKGKLAGTFEGIEELYKRISSASAGATAADRTAEAAEDMAEGIDEQLAALDRSEKQLGVINDTLKEISARLPVGVLA